MTTSVVPSPTQSAATPRNLYLARFAFALIWALIVIVSTPGVGLFLSVLVVIYPLVDAGAVFVQLTSAERTGAPRVPEVLNVVVSVVVAVAVGIASTMSVGATLGIWGVWAAVSGLTQLVTAVQRRRLGGQVPLMASGAISVAAGLSFVAQSLQGADSLSAIGGYALLGGIFFLASAVRLTVLSRRT